MCVPPEMGRPENLTDPMTLYVMICLMNWCVELLNSHIVVSVFINLYLLLLLLLHSRLMMMIYGPPSTRFSAYLFPWHTLCIHYTIGPPSLCLTSYRTPIDPLRNWPNKIRNCIDIGLYSAPSPAHSPMPCKLIQ